TQKLTRRAAIKSVSVPPIALLLGRKGDGWVDPAIREGAGCACLTLSVGREVAKARIAPVLALQAPGIVLSESYGWFHCSKHGNRGHDCECTAHWPAPEL